MKEPIDIDCGILSPCPATDAFYCLVVGSRSFDNYSLMSKKLDKLLSNQKKVVIVSGGARGADSLAERYAAERRYPCKVFKADWSIGKRAGFARNKQMHEYISSFEHRGVVAFWDGKSKGTAHNFELAKQYNNPIRIVRF